MSSGSGIWARQAPKLEHLARLGASGIIGEIGDLRSDLASVFSSMAGIAIDRWSSLAVSDVDAIKTAIASSASAVTYSGTALNGVIGAGRMDPPRNIIVTLSAHAHIDAVTCVITGRDINGTVMTEDILFTNGGGTTEVGNKAFASVTSIAIPAQSGVGGSMQFGFGNKVGFTKKLRHATGGYHLLAEVFNGQVIQTIKIDEFTNPPTGDTNAFVLSAKSSVKEVTRSGAGLDGVVGATALGYPRNVTVTCSDSAATWVGNATFTGRDVFGNVLTEAVALTNKATKAGASMFKSVTSIHTGAQVDANGDVEFGFGDILGPSAIMRIRGGATTPIPLQEIAVGAVVATGTLVAAAGAPPTGSYLPAAAPDATRDYCLTYETNMWGTVADPTVGAPNGTYQPAVLPNSVNHYAVYYPYDGTAP